MGMKQKEKINMEWSRQRVTKKETRKRIMALREETQKPKVIPIPEKEEKIRGHRKLSKKLVSK